MWLLKHLKFEIASLFLLNASTTKAGRSPLWGMLVVQRKLCPCAYCAVLEEMVEEKVLEVS